MSNKEYQWLLSHPEVELQYPEEYIGIVDDSLVAHSKDLREVLKKLNREEKRRLFIKFRLSTNWWYDRVLVQRSKVTNPTSVFKGDEDELWAAKLIGERKAMLVTYKESRHPNDGFIITAFLTTKIQKLLGRRVIWQRQR